LNPNTGESFYRVSLKSLAPSLAGLPPLPSWYPALPIEAFLKQRDSETVLSYLANLSAAASGGVSRLIPTSLSESYYLPPLKGDEKHRAALPNDSRVVIPHRTTRAPCTLPRCALRWGTIETGRGIVVDNGSSDLPKEIV